MAAPKLTGSAAETIRSIVVHSTKAKRMMVWTQLDVLLEPEVAAEMLREGRVVRMLQDSEKQKYHIFLMRNHNGVAAGPAIAGVDQHYIIIGSHNTGDWSKFLGDVLPRELGNSDQRISTSALAVLRQFAHEQGLGRGTYMFTGRDCIPVPPSALEDLHQLESALTIFELPMHDPRRMSNNCIARGVQNASSVELPADILVATYWGFVVSEEDMPAGHAGNGLLFNKCWTYGPIMLPRRSGGRSGEYHPGLYLLGNSMGSSIGPMINEAGQPEQANCGYMIMLSAGPSQCVLWIGIVTTRPVAPGMELVTTYGRGSQA